jgi:hypothetical protein
MHSEINNTCNYGVEISGWDAAERFFVEKTSLPLSDCSDKLICLQYQLRDGCVVFARLLPLTLGCDNFPVAYRAEIVQRDGVNRLTLLRLLPLHPVAPSSQLEEWSVPTEPPRRLAAQSDL